MTRALLWDIDGTLIDTTHLIAAALDHVYRAFLGRTLPEPDLRALIGIPLRLQMQALGDPAACGVDQREMESAFIRHYEANGHLERIVLPAVDALRQASRAGRLTALVTSKNRLELDNTLPRLEIAEHVHTVVCADDVAHPEPDPESVVVALDRLNVRPDEALYIGDTVHDMRAAAAAGVRRCAVEWGAAAREQLEAEAPELFCDDPERLAEMVLGT